LFGQAVVPCWKDRHALIDLEQSLKPDRSPEGLPAYAAEIERRVNRLAR